jgi:hypothetical protein
LRRLAAGFVVATEREMETEATLIELARETGGRALINSQRLRALDEVRADTSSYYWLGFTPDRRHDDRDYEIRVEVSRRGVEARSRRSFRDFSRRREVAMRVESRLLFDTEIDGAGRLAVELGSPDVRRRVRLPVTLTIPLVDFQPP